MKTEIKTRPILMNGAMVLATLSGTKTQARRVMKRQPHEEWVPVGYVELHGFDKHGELTPDKVIGWRVVNEDGDEGYCCQYGRPGDQVWVRETFSDVYGANGYEDRRKKEVMYRANGETDLYVIGGRWTPSIHMPRWASRITLEITGVRVERLHDISTEDIIAEGLSTTLRGYDAECDLRDQWRKLWESTGGDWDSNPWLWVIEFKKVKP